MDDCQSLVINKAKCCSMLITHTCMLKCKMCEMWRGCEGGQELSIEEWEQVIIELKKMLDREGEIHFTGGEPLLKNGILRLIESAAERGFRTGLNTNAYLIDKSMAEAISDSGLNGITISLESINEDIHDSMRGTPGSCRKVMDAIKYLSEFCPELNIGIATVITDSNLEGIIDLVHWVEKNQKLKAIRLQAMMQPLNTREDKNWYKNSKSNTLWPKNINKATSVLSKLISLKEQKVFYKLNNPVAQLNVFQDYFRNPSELPKIKNCIFFEQAVNISHLGDIYLCPELEPIGNVKNADMDGIWFSDQTNRVRQQMRQCQKSCKLLVNCFWE